MATIKSFTSLEQSKKLAKILPLESADMRFCFSHTLDGRVTGHYPMIGREPSMGTVPCWSLAALLGVLPDTITSNDGIAYKLNIKKNIIEYSNPSLYLIYKSAKSDNLIDACVAMIEKLHKLKML